MPFRDPIQYFEDILDNIERIETYCAGLDLQGFMTSKIVTDAVERCFARISEAAVKLGSDGQRLCPELPWNNIRGLGNHLRHDYRGVSTPILWRTIRNHLPPLRQGCERAIRILGDQEA